jgi:hypothetical protein
LAISTWQLATAARQSLHSARLNGPLKTGKQQIPRRLNLPQQAQKPRSSGAPVRRFGMTKNKKLVRGAEAPHYLEQIKPSFSTTAKSALITPHNDL